jgi:hypothetical protein
MSSGQDRCEWCGGALAEFSGVCGNCGEETARPHRHLRKSAGNVVFRSSRSSQATGSVPEDTGLTAETSPDPS